MKLKETARAIARRGKIVGSKAYLEKHGYGGNSPLNSRHINSEGYWVTAGGYLEHRRIYRRHHGKIPIGYHVHHIDQVKTNNSIANLIAMPGQCHTDLHDFMVIKGLRLNRKETETFITNWLLSQKPVEVRKFGKTAAPTVRLR